MFRRLSVAFPLCVAATAACPSLATSIVYWSQSRQNANVWSMSADGSHAIALVAASGIQEYYPIFRDDDNVLYSRWESATDQHDKIYNYNLATGVSGRELPARAVFEGYEAGVGTPAPGGAVLSQADIDDGNPWTSSYAYRYLDGWNQSPRVPAGQYDGVGETAWTAGGHAGVGTAAQRWSLLDNRHPEWYALDFAGFVYDHATFVTESVSPRYGHEDRWYDGTGGSWTLWDIRNASSPVEIASGTLGLLHLDIDYGLLNDAPDVRGGGVISVDSGSTLYDELMTRWGRAAGFEPARFGLDDRSGVRSPFQQTAATDIDRRQPATAPRRAENADAWNWDQEPFGLFVAGLDDVVDQIARAIASTADGALVPADAAPSRPGK